MVSHSGKTLRADRLRPLNIPQPVHVTLDKAGLPCAIEGPHICRAVEAITDTWRIDDEWWRELISRRYVEVVLSDGGHVALYEDLRTNCWFLQMP